MMSPEIHKDQLYDPAAAGHAASTDTVGGPRHLSKDFVPLYDPRAAWKCPSCGHENTTRALADGCEQCHAGEGAAKHVGVDPIVKPKPKHPDDQRALRMGHPGIGPDYAPTRLSTVQYADMQQFFVAWIAEAGTDVGPLAAFRAGWIARQGVTSPVTPKEHTDDPDGDPVARNHLVGGDLPDLHGATSATPELDAVPGDQGGAGPGADPADPADAGTAGFVGTAQERTLLAALIFFREQVMAQGPEEVVSGEWMSPEDVDRWIAELKGPYA